MACRNRGSKIGLAAALCCLPGLLAAQDSAKAKIHGAIADANFGTPLEECQVAARGASSAAIAVTGPGGIYTIPELPGGSYSLKVTCGGRTPETRRVKIQEGQDLAADFRILPAATITGRVADERGNPVPNITVLAICAEYSDGRIIHSRVIATNGPNGEYSVNVRAGYPYYIVAIPHWGRPGESGGLTASNDRGRKPFIAPTFWGNTTMADSTIPLVLQPGERREHTDIRMVLSPSYCVDGMVHLDEKAQNPIVVIQNELIAGLVSVRDIAGPFRVCDLAPGRYSVSAATTGTHRLTGSAELVIGTSDVHNVDITPAAGIAVHTEAVWDVTPQDAATRSYTFNIRLAPNQAAGENIATAETRIPYSGPFPAAAALPQPEEYRASVELNTPTVYVKELTYGGIDVLGQPFKVGAASDTLKAVLSTGAGAITVRVTDGDGDTVPDVFVVVMPDAANTVSRLSLGLVSGTTDQRGQYVATGLAPGKYHVLALSRILRTTEDDYRKLLGARIKAEDVDVGTSGNVQVNLRGVSID